MGGSGCAGCGPTSGASWAETGRMHIAPRARQPSPIRNFLGFEFFIVGILVSQNAKSKPSMRLLLLRSVPSGAVPRCLIQEYSLWKANPARLDMNGL